MPIIFSCHPRTRKRLEAKKIRLPRLVKVMKPMGLFDYVHLQMNAFCTLSDSGTIYEESTIMSFPAVSLRESQEKPEGMDETANILSGLNPERVLQAIEMTRNQLDSGFKPTLPLEYSYPNVSKKVARIILSYIDYVHRTVWQKLV